MTKPIDTPLYAALNDVINKDFSRFHMPGHKGCDRSGLFGEVLRYDFTEVDGTDSLYHASEAILRSEQRIAAYYGAKRSLFSTQGSTLCIQTMLALVRGRGKTLVIARGAHVAAANAAALLNFDLHWVYPDVNTKTGVPLPVTPQQIANALAGGEEVAAVYVTSPSYYGVLTDISGIARVCKSYGVPLIVDSAHGAHLKASGLPDPIEQGAAMCAQSAHKTLPVITGGAFLHIADEQFVCGAKEEMSLFGSTSPSYLTMLSLDACASYLEADAHAEFSALRTRIQLLEQLALSQGFTQIFSDDVARDDTRLCLCAADLGYTGAQLVAHLARYAIEPEYAGENTVVLLASPANTERDYERLSKAIIGIVPTGITVASVPKPVQPVQAISPHKALFSKRECVPLAEAAGRIAARNQSSCPPGVPVVLCGELITPEAQGQMHHYGIESVWVVRRPEELTEKGQ